MELESDRTRPAEMRGPVAKGTYANLCVWPCLTQNSKHHEASQNRVRTPRMIEASRCSQRSGRNSAASSPHSSLPATRSCDLTCWGHWECGCDIDIDASEHIRVSRPGTVMQSHDVDDHRHLRRHPPFPSNKLLFGGLPDDARRWRRETKCFLQTPIQVPGLHPKTSNHPSCFVTCRQTHTSVVAKVCNFPRWSHSNWLVPTTSSISLMSRSSRFYIKRIKSVS